MRRKQEKRMLTQALAESNWRVSMNRFWPKTAINNFGELDTAITR